MVTVTMPIQIKVCGLTRPADAKLALAHGANFLGLIFVPGTPRAVSLDQAKAIEKVVLSTRETYPEQTVGLVGVFQDAPLQDVQYMLSRLSLDAVQLHGQESPAFCEAVSATHRVIKVIEFYPEKAECWLPTWQQYAPYCHYALLDRPKAADKSTEALYAWQTAMMHFFMAHQLDQLRVFVAGGLNDENISKILQKINPFGIDVASGVERSAGIKDEAKLERFCYNIRLNALLYNPPRKESAT
jgi:phosphoribosylanthranilate isomerase